MEEESDSDSDTGRRQDRGAAAQPYHGGRWRPTSPPPKSSLLLTLLQAFAPVNLFSICQCDLLDLPAMAGDLLELPHPSPPTGSSSAASKPLPAIPPPVPPKSAFKSKPLPPVPTTIDDDDGELSDDDAPLLNDSDSGPDEGEEDFYLRPYGKPAASYVAVLHTFSGVFSASALVLLAWSYHISKYEPLSESGRERQLASYTDSLGLTQVMILVRSNNRNHCEWYKELTSICQNRRLVSISFGVASFFILLERGLTTGSFSSTSSTTLPSGLSSSASRLWGFSHDCGTDGSANSRRTRRILNTKANSAKRPATSFCASK